MTERLPLEGLTIDTEPDKYGTRWVGVGPMTAAACPRCGSTDPAVRLPVAYRVFICNDPWHDRPTGADPTCTGASDCPVAVHFHGCYADMGDCDSPDEHRHPYQRPTGAERYLTERLKDPEYRAAYEAARPTGADDLAARLESVAEYLAPDHPDGLERIASCRAAAARLRELEGDCDTRWEQTR